MRLKYAVVFIVLSIILPTGICESPRSQCEPVVEPNGDVTYSTLPSPLFALRTVAHVKCRSSTTTQRSTCTPDGWEPIPYACPTPQCEEITDVSNGTISYSHAAPYVHHTTATLACDQGYTVVGSQIVTCGPDGQWSEHLGACHFDVECPVLEVIPPGVVVYSYHEQESRKQGTKALLLCPYRNTVQHVDTVTCLRNGRWSGVLATCPKIKTCSSIEMHNGLVAYSPPERLFHF
ncbi:hypothetical protein AB6A40_004320 [Gnathostoma spinigerum]|uniref:Sushi domain-containing protein n=1 Tax=Gnathostoma spinigerum TaxID=75299 RepID=A0ABD6EEG5_9BILA